MFLCLQINTNFGLQLLIMSVISLNAIIFHLYNIYYIKTDNSSMNILIINIIMISFHILRFLYISYICQRSGNEVEYLFTNLYNKI